MVGALHRDLHGAVGYGGGELVEGGGRGVGHDGGYRQVVAVGLLGAEAERGGHATAPAQQGRQGAAVTGEVQGGVDAVRLDAPDSRGEVTAVVDGAVGAEAGDQGALVLGGGGGDDRGSPAAGAGWRWHRRRRSPRRRAPSRPGWG